MSAFIRTGSVLLGSAAMALCSFTLHAQNFPSKPIRTLIGSGAGSGNDIVMRTVSPAMSKILGQSIVVENMPGASGVIAYQTVARNPPDGYTLLLSGSTSWVGTAFVKNPEVDLRKDFASISLLAETPLFLLTNAGAPWNSLKDLVAYAKANPGKLNQGVTSLASIPYIYMVAIAQKNGFSVVGVPYKNTSAVMQQA